MDFREYGVILAEAAFHGATLVATFADIWRAAGSDQCALDHLGIELEGE